MGKKEKLVQRKVPDMLEKEQEVKSNERIVGHKDRGSEPLQELFFKFCVRWKLVGKL